MTTLKRLIRKSKSRKDIFQSGTIYESSGRLYVKYRVTVDGVRKRVSHPLCDLDPENVRKSWATAEALRGEYMRGMSEQIAASAPSRVTIAAFWESVYLPFLKADKRSATVKGYIHLWKRWLKPHFGEAALNAYMTETATEFLTLLSGKLNRNSYNHVRSLMSGLFSHAIAIGKTKYGIAFNPIHDAHSVSSKIKTPAEVAAYSLGELEDSISALHEHPDAQLMLALAGFEGLRPSEILGLRWSDITDDLICIRRAVVNGVEGDCKTPESVDDIPLLTRVKLYAALWRVKSGNPPADAWVFPNTTGRKPINLRDYTRRVFKPILGDRFVGLYKARRSAASILTKLTGNAIAASRILRHNNIGTTTKHYVANEEMRAALEAGMKQLEAVTTKV
jgi:integrase